VDFAILPTPLDPDYGHRPLGTECTVQKPLKFHRIAYKWRQTSLHPSLPDRCRMDKGKKTEPGAESGQHSQLGEYMLSISSLSGCRYQANGRRKTIGSFGK